MAESLLDIGFVGAGEMACAMVAGIVSKLNPKSIMASSPTGATKLDRYGAVCSKSNSEIFKNCKIVVIACKPTQVPDILKEWKDSVKKDSIKASGVVSICAGVKLSQLEELNCPVIRIMPNLGVRVGAGTLPYCTSANCTEDFEKSVMSIFEPLGLAVKVPEKFFNAAQGISGCGPAFIALFIESLVDAGVREGLTRDVAWRLACQTVYGTGKLMLETNTSPSDLKYKVCSPGGVSIAGVVSLEKTGFRSSVIEAHRATIEKTKEMERAAQGMN